MRSRTGRCSSPGSTRPSRPGPSRHRDAGLDGLGALERLRERHPDLPVVMLSGKRRSSGPSRPSASAPTTFSRSRSRPRSSSSPWSAPSPFRRSGARTPGSRRTGRADPDFEMIGTSAAARSPHGDRPRRTDAGQSAHPRRERHGQGARGPRHPRRLAARPGPFIKVNCARSRATWSNRSSSATRRGRSRAHHDAEGQVELPTRGRSSSTKWATCRRRGGQAPARPRDGRGRASGGEPAIVSSAGIAATNKA